MDPIRSKKRLSFANKKKTKFANRQVDEIYLRVHFRFFHVLNQQSKQWLGRCVSPGYDSFEAERAEGVHRGL